MTSNAPAGTRILGTLRSEDGKGVLRVEDRVDNSIDDVWSALTDPSRLARWYGEVGGDLRASGEYHARVFASGWEGTGRVETCEPGQRLVLLGAEPDDPDQQTTEVTLAAEGGQTIVAVEQRGIPLDLLAAFGAGMQVHVEDLLAHLAGQERCDPDVRWGELQPAYDDMAADIAK